MTDIKETLRLITAADGVSGTEEDTARVIETLMRQFTDDVKTDALGDLIAVVGNGGKKIMVSAHMDKIGLSVTGIDPESGMLRVAKCGGTDIRTLAAQRVKVYGRRVLDGAVISVPPHLSAGAPDVKAVPVTETAVDCGLPYEAVKEIVSPGDRVEVRQPFTELLGGRIASPFLDNAAGCAALIAAAGMISGQNCPNTLIAVFSTREEVGKQGASAAAYGTAPDEALAVDVTFASQKGVAEEVSAPLGSGARIGFSPILSKKIGDSLTALAGQNGIPFTREVMGRTTGTDADVITVSREGVPTGLVSVPLKYMHTPTETVDAADIDAAARLIAAYVMKTEDEER